MTISLSDAGKRYNRDWIFRHVTYQLSPGHSYAITGPNGSGKSTLLQAISGSLLLNEGTCDWSLPQFNLTPENIYRHVSICAPSPWNWLARKWLLRNYWDFHKGFQTFSAGITTKSIIEESLDWRKPRTNKSAFIHPGWNKEWNSRNVFFQFSTGIIRWTLRAWIVRVSIFITHWYSNIVPTGWWWWAVMMKWSMGFVPSGSIWPTGSNLSYIYSMKEWSYSLLCSLISRAQEFPFFIDNFY